ncbi:MAG TPA: glycosyltransferase family 4 protein [Polyangiaceae bacterium]|jgi:teichuronic acid biosynthesis glycosyltransferase TuaC|nr:glycosyltransferase family 4 protein [Polyangiaceae bacterium]
MRVLIVTKIFPNQAEPLSSPFNRRQFAALARLCDVEVLATIPWFPGATAFRRWSSVAHLSSVPESESIDGLRVKHPRYVFLPKIGHGVAGPLYAASLAPMALSYAGRIDAVLGSWAYPDGFAAVVLAQMLGVPAVIKLHGSDMNVVAKWPGPRRCLRWALPRAERVVAVSGALVGAAVQLGVPRERIDLVPNGIDRTKFKPRDRQQARRELGLPLQGPLLLYVGHVTQAKGAFDLVRAFAAARSRLPASARLVLVGDGAELEACKKLGRELSDAISFVGAERHERIPTWLAACDALALPSWNEGMPNVVLEALASGRRVVATRVGGIPEVVTDELGVLVPVRDLGALELALGSVLTQSYDPQAISRALKRPDWDGSARLLHESLLSALQRRASREAA